MAHPNPAEVERQPGFTGYAYRTSSSHVSAIETLLFSTNSDFRLWTNLVYNRKLIGLKPNRSLLCVFLYKVDLILGQMAVLEIVIQYWFHDHIDVTWRGIKVPPEA